MGVLIVRILLFRVLYVGPPIFRKLPSTYLSFALQNSNLHNYYPKPKYLIIGSCGPLMISLRFGGVAIWGLYRGFGLRI